MNEFKKGDIVTFLQSSKKVFYEVKYCSGSLTELEDAWIVYTDNIRLATELERLLYV